MEGYREIRSRCKVIPTPTNSETFTVHLGSKELKAMEAALNADKSGIWAEIREAADIKNKKTFWVVVIHCHTSTFYHLFHLGAYYYSELELPKDN